MRELDVIIKKYQEGNDLYKTLFNRIFYAKVYWNSDFIELLQRYNIQTTKCYQEYLLYHDNWLNINYPHVNIYDVLSDWKSDMIDRFPVLMPIYRNDPTIFDNKTMADIIQY